MFTRGSDLVRVKRTNAQHIQVKKRIQNIYISNKQPSKKHKVQKKIYILLPCRTVRGGIQCNSNK